MGTTAKIFKRRLTAVFATGTLAFGLTGIAMAQDGSPPPDPDAAASAGQPEAKSLPSMDPRTIQALVTGQDFSERIVRLYGEVNGASASQIISEMRLLDEIDPGQPITMVIDSPGGDVSQGGAIYDTMKSLASPVYTECLGQCASMGAVLLIGGESGHRSAAPNAVVMVHQVASGTQGKVSQMQTDVGSAASAEDRIIRIIAAYSGQKEEAIKAFIQQDKFLSAEQAKDLGFIDTILAPLHTATPPTPVVKLRVPTYQP